MKRIFVLGLLCLLATFNLPAQNPSDSAYLDLGRMQLRREFAQVISLKGEDLEKLPFTNISEVVNVWFSGSLSNKGDLTYVVDGNIVQDVNAFHIRDIADIMLVDNALSRLNGATGNQQLVLIRTRKGTKGKALSVAAQFNRLDQLERLGEDATASEPALFHQYIVSGHHNINGYRFGGSASFLRDANPLSGFVQTVDLYDLNRFRIRAFAEKQLSEKQNLGLQLNYLYQHSDNEFIWRLPDYSSYYDGNNVAFPRQLTRKNGIGTGLFNSEVLLNSRFSRKLTNRLNLNFNSLRYYHGSNMEDRLSDTQPSFSHVTDSLRTGLRSINLRNNLSYSASIGNWTIEPAINLAGRITGELTKRKLSEVRTTGTSGGVMQLMVRENEEDGLFNYLYITPSFSFYYKSSFHVQTGFLLNLTAVEEASLLNPFVSTSLDVIRLSNPEADLSWKFFGSFAQNTELSDPLFYLSDFATGSQPNYPLIGIDKILHLAGDNKTRDQHVAYQAGTAFSMLKEKLTFSYNYLRNNNHYQVNFHYYPINGTYIPLYNEVPLTQVFETHRVSIRLDLPFQTDLSWVSQLNGASTLPERDLYTTSKLRYLAWANRFSYKKAFLGVDLGGRFLKQQELVWPNSNSQTDPTSIPRAGTGTNQGSSQSLQESRYHEWAVNNLYFGYRLSLAQKFPLEVYVNARNLIIAQNLQNGQTRRFAGTGVKIDF